jgi:hypothetical protein
VLREGTERTHKKREPFPWSGQVPPGVDGTEAAHGPPPRGSSDHSPPSVSATLLLPSVTVPPPLPFDGNPTPGERVGGRGELAHVTERWVRIVRSSLTHVMVSPRERAPLYNPQY